MLWFLYNFISSHFIRRSSFTDHFQTSFGYIVFMFLILLLNKLFPGLPNASSFKLWISIGSASSTISNASIWFFFRIKFDLHSENYWDFQYRILLIHHIVSIFYQYFFSICTISNFCYFSLSILSILVFYFSPCVNKRLVSEKLENSITSFFLGFNILKWALLWFLFLLSWFESIPIFFIIIAKKILFILKLSNRNKTIIILRFYHVIKICWCSKNIWYKSFFEPVQILFSHL